MTTSLDSGSVAFVRVSAKNPFNSTYAANILNQSSVDMLPSRDESTNTHKHRISECQVHDEHTGRAIEEKVTDEACPSQALDKDLPLPEEIHSTSIEPTDQLADSSLMQQEHPKAESPERPLPDQAVII